MMQLRLRDHYDWVVLGENVGAILSACLAARLGLSVLVLPVGTTFLPRVSKGGQCLDPESNFQLGLSPQEGAGGLLYQVLDRIGILPAEKEAILWQESLAQVATPEGRISLCRELKAFELEWERELGKKFLKARGLKEAFRHARQEYSKFWNELPQRLTHAEVSKGALKQGERSLKDLKKRVAVSSADVRWNSETKTSDLGEGFSEIASAVLYASGQVLDDDPCMGDFLHLLALAGTGSAFRGGATALRELLLRVVRRFGGHVPDKLQVKRLFIEEERLAGVQVAQRGNMISVSGGILGCHLADAEALMTGEHQKLLSKQRRVSPVGWRFSIAFTVHAEAIPTGMERRLIWKEEGAPVLEVEVALPEDYSLRESDKRLVFLRTVLPFTPETLDPGYQAMVAARMLRQVSQLIPYLQYHVVRIYPDFTDSTEELREVYSFDSLKAIPGNLLCYSGEGCGHQSVIQGLFIASPESFPELGTLGPLVAAMESVAWLAHRSGLPGPLE